MEIIEPHFTFDEHTRIITFKKDEERYTIEKAIFAKHDVDIDRIQTVEDYDTLRLQYFEDILAQIYKHYRESNPVSIEDKFMKSLILEDVDEYNRLKRIRNQLKDANIRVIK